MKIAITGASGFIGQYVLKALENENVEIIAITRSEKNISNPYNRYKVVEMDISNIQDSDYDTMNRPDVMIHLAWEGLPNYLSVHHFENELPKHYRFIKNLILSGLPKIVISGTCFEYGMQSGELCENNVTIPNNPYGLAKDMLRRELEFLQKDYSFFLIWTRLFYTFGEGQSNSALYTQIKNAVKNGEKIFNMSGGEQLRDFLPVEEIAFKLVFLSKVNQVHGVFNICSGKPISVRRLVEGWIMLNNWNIDLNLGYYPYPAYEPMAFWGSEKKLQSIMNEKTCDISLI